MRTIHPSALAVLAVTSIVPLATPALAQAYVNFEAPQTNAIAVSADGTRLYALETPDHRLAVFQLNAAGAPLLLKEIPVGLGPISVRPRTTDEVWVVNFVSDSISVVSVSAGVVVDTIRVVDEPGDVVFAGSPQRAFVSVGTNREVRVFDPVTRAQVATVPIFGDDPRSLAVSADGRRVWVAVHRSGNGTTVVPANLAPFPPPPTNPNLPPAPQQSIIVNASDPAWQQLGVVLPDVDVVEIDATSLQVREYATVGTTLFQLAARPGTDEVWVANTDARNRVRFEPAVRGHLVDNRVTRITTGASPTVQPFDLNPGINYATLPNPAALATALAQPTGLTFDPAGNEMFVAAFGTDRVAIVDPQTGGVTARIEMGNASGATAAPRDKRGPRALAHHPTLPLLYVLNRLRNSITIVDTRQRTVAAELPMVFDPTPALVKQGRGFFYDAKLSGNGTAACAACHQDGTFDGLAWDLGNPGGQMEVGIDQIGQRFDMHPMKGAMVTQTLQGLRDAGPFHWRGDRRTLADFNGAFQSLLGGSTLAPADIADFSTFVESIVYPGNPNQNLDRTQSTAGGAQSAATGEQLFQTFLFNTVASCTSCHALDKGTRRIILDGAVIGESQPFKAAQLRNVYKRTGRKPQARGRTSGFGLQFDGHSDSVDAVLTRGVFGLLINDPPKRTALMRFVEAFDTGTAPIVGFTRTVHANNASDPKLLADLNLMVARARTPDCDLVATGRLDGEAAGYTFDPVSSTFVPDVFVASSVTLANLLGAIGNGRGTLSFLCVPRGSGVRIGVDRDLDFAFDGDERPVRYGAATPAACAPALAIDVNSPPRLGNALFGLVVSNAAPSAPALLVVGTKRASLPLADLQVLVDSGTGFVVPLQAAADGVVVVPVPLPQQAALTGARLHVQAIAARSCGMLGVQASAGLEITVGN